jgi:hypothetical protein
MFTTKCENPCRQCGAPRPDGYAATCGRSHCQEAEYRANAERANCRHCKALSRPTPRERSLGLNRNGAMCPDHAPNYTGVR